MTRHELRQQPKVELHRHLDGSVRYETIADLARYHNLDLGPPEELRSRTKITEPMDNLDAVLETFATTQKVLCSYEAIRRITISAPCLRPAKRAEAFTTALIVS